MEWASHRKNEYLAAIFVPDRFAGLSYCIVIFCLSFRALARDAQRPDRPAAAISGSTRGFQGVIAEGKRTHSDVRLQSCTAPILMAFWRLICTRAVGSLFGYVWGHMARNYPEVTAGAVVSGMTKGC
jgi:hypothetical protein